MYIIIKNGITTLTPGGANLEALPLSGQTDSIDKHAGETFIHFDYSIHLSRVLSNPHLRGFARRGKRPLHVDASYISLQPRHTHVVGPIAHHLRRLDFAITHRYWHHYRRSKNIAR